MKKIIYLTILITLTSCFSKNKSSDNILTPGISNDLYIVDLDNTKEEDTIYCSSFFKENVKTIILENKSEALIGKIDGLQVWDDIIFILDKAYAKGLFVFDKEGHFLRQIGKIGQGPGEYSKIFDFTIDAVNKEIYLLDSDAQKINKYKIETGEFVESIVLHNEPLEARHIQYYENQMFADAFYIDKKINPKYMLWEIDSFTGKSKGNWLDISQYNCDWNEFIFKGESSFICRGQESPKYCQMFMDTVMQIQNGKIMPYLTIKTSKWITKKDIDKMKEGNPEKDIFHQIMNSPFSFDITNFAECKDIVYFTYYKEREPIFVLFNKKTNLTRYTKLFVDDLVFTKPFCLKRVGCADSNGIYVYVDSNDMLDLINKIKNDVLNPSIDKKEQLSQLTLDSNPILFYYEYNNK